MPLEELLASLPPSYLPDNMEATGVKEGEEKEMGAIKGSADEGMSTEKTEPIVEVEDKLRGHQRRY